MGEGMSQYQNLQRRKEKQELGYILCGVFLSSWRAIWQCLEKAEMCLPKNHMTQLSGESLRVTLVHGLRDGHCSIAIRKKKRKQPTCLINRGLDKGIFKHSYTSTLH